MGYALRLLFCEASIAGGSRESYSSKATKFDGQTKQKQHNALQNLGISFFDRFKKDAARYLICLAIFATFSGYTLSALRLCRKSAAGKAGVQLPLAAFFRVSGSMEKFLKIGT